MSDGTALFFFFLGGGCLQSLMVEAGKLGLLKVADGSGSALIGRVRSLAEGEGTAKR